MVSEAGASVSGWPAQSTLRQWPPRMPCKKEICIEGQRVSSSAVAQHWSCSAISLFGSRSSEPSLTSVAARCTSSMESLPSSFSKLVQF
eukprot:1614755-Prymnesium_polylepis.2